MARYMTKMKLSYDDYLESSDIDNIAEDDINKWINQIIDTYESTENDKVVLHAFCVPDKKGIDIRKKKYSVVCNDYEVDEKKHIIMIDLELILDK